MPAPTRTIEGLVAVPWGGYGDGEAVALDDEKVPALVGHLVAAAQSGLLKTQVAKLLYLVDVEWMRATGASLTGAEWAL